MQATREANLAAKKAESINRMMGDLSVDRSQNPGAFANDRWDPEQEGDEEDDDDGNGSDGDIIDRSTSSFTCCLLSQHCPHSGEERGPGDAEYIDVTRMRRGGEGIRWPRPG